MRSLIIPALRTSLLGALGQAILIFLPAGTLDYWQGWAFIVVFMGSADAIGIYLTLKDPALLERRKKVGPAAETSRAQKAIMTLAIVGFLAMIAFSGFDRRFGWSQVPALVAIAGDVLVALGFLIHIFVFRENSYGAATVQTFEGQKVISTGPYALVRHPMYGGVLIMVLGVPLALASWWGLAFLALTISVLIWRILDEERLLKQDLSGYLGYTRKVHYRLVPYLW